MSQLQQAMEHAAAHGVKLTAADYAAMAAIQQAEQERARALDAGKRWDIAALVDAFNRYYPAFLRGLVGLSQVLITTSQTVIVSFGVPIVLVLLLIVEHSRVMHGILLFETSAALASFAAWSLVILNTTLEFVIHHIEQQAGYHAALAQRASLRLHWQSLTYWIGIRRDWQPIALSPAHRYKKLLKLVTFSILALALAGSMKGVIAEMSTLETGATVFWYKALWLIATQSTLAQMTTWAGGLLFALAAVAGAQNLTAYLANRVAEIIAQMEKVTAKADEKPGEAAAAQYIMAKVAERELKLSQKARATKVADEDTAEVLTVDPALEIAEVGKTDTPLSRNGSA